MKLNDIYLLAKAVEDTLPEIARENGGQNIRPNISVHLNVSKLELETINRELYSQTNNTLSGYQPSDEVIVDIFGISFYITEVQSEQ